MSLESEDRTRRSDLEELEQRELDELARLLRRIEEGLSPEPGFDRARIWERVEQRLKPEVPDFQPDDDDDGESGR